MNVENNLIQIEKLTQTGIRSQALQLIHLLLQSKPKREYLVRLANFSNRNNSYVLAMRILYPIIKVQNQLSNITPTFLEINTYATSLIWIGSFNEAEHYLNQISDFHPSWLTKAFLHLGRWEYKKALPYLKKYIHSPELTNYQRLVGEINLLSVYVGLRLEHDAIKLFNKLQKNLIENEHHLLLGNSHELIGQLYYFKLAFTEAEYHLQCAQTLLKDRAYRYRIFVEKWLAILNLHKNPDSIKAQSGLIFVRNEASRINHYETIRDCDFHLARLTKNYELMRKVYWGSSNRGYKNILMQNYPLDIDVMKKFNNKIENIIYNPTNIANINYDSKEDGNFSLTNLNNEVNLDMMNLSSKLTCNKNFWTILNEITKDIYKPPKIGELFSVLYSNEYFNPFTSPSRVRNMVKRLNIELKFLFYEPRIQLKNGNLLFSSDNTICIKRPIQLFVHYDQFLLKVFKQKWGSKRFNVTQFSNEMKISKPTAKMILKSAETRKVIRPSGTTNRQIDYLFYGVKSGSK